MSQPLRLVHDLLDVELLDRNKRKIGRVDGVILELRASGPPRVVAMEVGVATALRRMHPRAARWLRAFAVRCLPVPIAPVRFALSLFREVGVDIELDVDALQDRRQLRLEKWLRRHIVNRLPGSGE